MNDNNLLLVKLEERLNKLSSKDYDNIECWQKAEAFNKVQLEWARRQISGLNQLRIADEGSKQLTDDLQVLLSEKPLPFTAHALLVETELLPDNYLAMKRVSATAHTSCCGSAALKVYPSTVADVDDNLRDFNKRPNFAWRETFYTLGGNRLRVYTGDEFSVDRVLLTYYRKPRPISFLGCVDPVTGEPTPDVTCELKEDVFEILVDEAVAVLAGDMENQLQMQRAKAAATANT